MTVVKYIYDYPVNREIARYLTFGDKIYIARSTGYTISYVGKWCKGIRKNDQILALAKNLSDINIECEVKKQQMITNQ